MHDGEQDQLHDATHSLNIGKSHSWHVRHEESHEAFYAVYPEMRAEQDAPSAKQAKLSHAGARHTATDNISMFLLRFPPRFAV